LGAALRASKRSELKVAIPHWRGGYVDTSATLTTSPSQFVDPNTKRLDTVELRTGAEGPFLNPGDQRRSSGLWIISVGGVEEA
jgi:hypothetical protein